MTIDRTIRNRRASGDLVLETQATGTVRLPTGPSTTNQVPAADRTIPSGESLMHANLVIPSGTTWTVASGGSLQVLTELVVDGTLLVSGTARVI